MKIYTGSLHNLHYSLSIIYNIKYYLGIVNETSKNRYVFLIQSNENLISSILDPRINQWSCMHHQRCPLSRVLHAISGAVYLWFPVSDILSCLPRFLPPHCPQWISTMKLTCHLMNHHLNLYWPRTKVNPTMDPIPQGFMIQQRLSNS